MELKDLIKQTLNEFQDLSSAPNPPAQTAQDPSKAPKAESSQPQQEEFARPVIDANAKFLEILREKTLVLFEGLQNSQTKDLSAKLDLVINYLEYQLSLIDEALKDID